MADARSLQRATRGAAPFGAQHTRTRAEMDGRPAPPSTMPASVGVVRERPPEASGRRATSRVLGAGWSEPRNGLRPGWRSRRCRAARSDARRAVFTNSAHASGRPDGEACPTPIWGFVPSGCQLALVLAGEAARTGRCGRARSTASAAVRAAKSTVRFSSEGATVRESGSECDVRVIKSAVRRPRRSRRRWRGAERCLHVERSTWVDGAARLIGRGMVRELRDVSRSSDVEVPRSEKRHAHGFRMGSP